MNLKNYIYYVLLACICTSTFAQHQVTEEPPSLVKWLTFEEAFELNKKQPKPFIIDVYTDWCGWCKHMLKTTYSTPDIANYINNWFYPVKFNAETKDTIEYLGTKYFNAGTTAKSTHQLTIKLLGKQLMYPSTIFTNYNTNFTLNSQGYLDSKKIEPLLIYTLENIYKTCAYEDFSANFEKTFYDTTKAKVELKWHTFNEAITLNKTKPKKIIISAYTSWCNGCRVMNKTTFSDSINVEYVNKNFYLVDFNAESKDTITYNGATYKNTGATGTPFHDLILTLVNNNLALPTTIIMDEKVQPIDVIPQYLSPTAVEPILRFYGTNAYKTDKWEDFSKKFGAKKITPKK